MERPGGCLRHIGVMTSRRWSQLIAVPVVILGSWAISGCGSSEPVAGPDPAATTSGAGEPLPAGWRWESYAGVEVGVPADWGWGNGTQRLGQWCVSRGGDRSRPIVGRPGAATLVGCAGANERVRPQTLLKNTGQVVAFERSTKRAEGVTHEGDSTTVDLNGVAVTVIAPPELRQRIVDTVHETERDSHGCPVTHAVSEAPETRPEPADVTTLRAVSAVSACKYDVVQGGLPRDPRLRSSLRLDGAEAARAVERIAEAPADGGPNAPDQCLADVSYGDDILVLRIQSQAGLSEVVVRYAGCDHNGFDDGVTVRALTAASMKPLIAGPNAVYSFSGPEQKQDILRPTN